MSANTENVGPANVLAFWRGIGPDRWFKKDAALDAEITSRFSALWHEAAAGRLASWEEDAGSALALIILLDQFPRNMFRGEARAFATDPLARTAAERAIARGFDQAVPTSERLFFYLPFEHSENVPDQERAVTLVRTIGDADLTRWAELHADIIRRFGRFPHRNSALGRSSTREEQAFLNAGGFAG
ncbi:MAG TPA: DUF924 family protein [Steroidobacteraceae bacterium]